MEPDATNQDGPNGILFCTNQPLKIKTPTSLMRTRFLGPVACMASTIITLYACVHAFACLLAVVCQLEASGKWPDQLPGIRAIKSAFYLHLSRAVCEQHRGGVLASPTANYLDILKVPFSKYAAVLSLKNNPIRTCISVFTALRVS